MKLEDFDYHCPEHIIAQSPLAHRDQCKLLHLDASRKTHHKTFSDIVELIPKNALLVLNDTKVIPARIPIRRESGGKGEMLIQSPSPEGGFIAMGRPSKRLKVGELVQCTRNSDFQIELLERLDEGYWRINFIPELHYPDDLDKIGEIPLPPYIQREQGPDSEDLQLYQTVFASTPGSAAAPTASLHFTPELLQQLKDKGVILEKITLHVGSGTFLPIRADKIEDHVMHYESYYVPEKVALQIKRHKENGHPVVAVGTTVVRTLESAFQSILNGQGESGESNLFIRPPYEFKIVDNLITNFHLPKSTLLMLVSSLCGVDTLQKAYREAIDEDYRFFSYGDAMYLEKPKG